MTEAPTAFFWRSSGIFDIELLLEHIRAMVLLLSEKPRICIVLGLSVGLLY